MSSFQVHWIKLTNSNSPNIRPTYLYQHFNWIYKVFDIFNCTGEKITALHKTAATIINSLNFEKSCDDWTNLTLVWPTRPVLIMKQQQLVFKITIFYGKIEKWVGTLVGYSYQIFTVYKRIFFTPLQGQIYFEKIAKIIFDMSLYLLSFHFLFFCFLPLNLFDCLLFYSFLHSI